MRDLSSLLLGLGKAAAMKKITVWWCDKCDYGRLEKSTGVHSAPNPDDWRGHNITHDLRPVVFVAEEDIK